MTARLAEPGEARQGHDRRGHAAGREPSGYPPVDGAVETMDERAATLRDGGVEEIGPDRGRGHDPEDEHQQRRHQRAAPDAREADEAADDETRDRIERINRMDEIEHGTLSLQFRHHPGGAAGLGNFHLFLAQSLQIIPIHPDLESASHHKPSLVSSYIKSIEINLVNSLRGALDDFRSLEDFFWQQEARLAPATGNRVIPSLDDHDR
jgi:hypothetical protein